MNRDEILCKIYDCGDSLYNYRRNQDIIDDREIVLAAINNDGCELAYASKRLRNDRRVVIEAIRRDPKALKYASRSLLQDASVVAEAVKLDPRMALLVDKSFLKDVDFASELLNANREVSKYLPHGLVDEIYESTSSVLTLDRIKHKKSMQDLTDYELSYLESLVKKEKKSRSKRQ